MPVTALRPAMKLSTGRYANSLFHRRDEIAHVGIEYRPRQARIPLRTEMPVIAALDCERQAHTERIEQIRCPRP